MDGELVIRRRQSKRFPIRPVLRLIDCRLQMLDADAHGERFRLHRDPCPFQHFKRISGAVPERKDHLVAREHGRSFWPGQLCAGDLSVLRSDPGELSAEANLAAQGEDSLSQPLNDGD